MADVSTVILTGVMVTVFILLLVAIYKVFWEDDE